MQIPCTDQQGNIDRSRLHSPSQEELTSIQERDTTERILEHGVRLQTDGIRHVRGATTHWPDCLPPPRTVQHGVERSSPSLQFLQWEREPRGDKQPPPAFGLFCRSPYSDLTLQRLQGNLHGSTTGHL